MKSIYSVLLTGFLVLFFIPNLWAQETENRQLDADFHALSVSGAFEVVIYDRPQNGKIELEGAQKDLDKVIMEVKEGRLILKRDRGLNIFEPSDRTVRVSLDAHNLKSISLSGSGKIVTKGFQEVDEFKASLSGSGSLEAKVTAQKAKVALSGPGSINIAGEADHLEVKRSGSGAINAFQLKTNSTKILGSGSGHVQLSVEEELKVAAIGSGDVLFKGYPEVEIQSAGSGKVVEAN